MAEKKKGKLADKDGKELNPAKETKKPEPKLAGKFRYLVFFATDANSILAPDARSAVRHAAEQFPAVTGKFIVVEPEFVEMFSATRKVQISQEDVEKSFFRTGKTTGE